MTLSTRSKEYGKDIEVLQISDSISVLEVAQKALRQEIEGLEALREALEKDDVFEKVVSCFLGISGRIIVTGMGKSGHVGHKIASTLASTGTPSFFVHPAEASHGDLGMITSQDAILALSNSGKTKELSDILEYAHRLSVPLIAMTQDKNSLLAQYATYVLCIPGVPEACPNGLAPTTSTTMMMALGDALSITLLKRREFSSRDFKNLHPGGELGRKLLRVQDLMHSGKAQPLIRIGSSVKEAIAEISQKGFGCVGIIDSESVLIGIITDGDLRRHIGSSFLEKKVEDIMTKNPQTLSLSQLAADALARMQKKAITALFVVDEKQQAVGILNIHDCLRTQLI